MIYVASPYSHPDKDERQKNFMAANYWCHVNQGYFREFLFSPIVYHHFNVTQFSMPTDFTPYKELNEDCILASSQLILLALPGWTHSAGCKAEVAFARSRGIPCSIIDEPSQYLYQSGLRTFTNAYL